MSAQTLSASLEDYLEAILDICSQNHVARAMEIASRLRVKRSSVTVALQALAQRGLVHYAPRSYVTLTDAGRAVASCIDQRHQLLSDFFVKVLKLSPDRANATACQMEHGMSHDVCSRMAAMLATLEEDPSLAEVLGQGVEARRRTLACEKSCTYGDPEIGDLQEGARDLNTLVRGESAQVAKVQGSGDFKRRLREMGVVPGATVTMIRAAPLDDPIEFRIGNSHLSLRREEACQVQVRHEG